MLNDGLDEIEAFMVVGLAGDQLLEDAKQALDLLYNLGRSPGDKSLEQPDQRVDVSRPLPEQGYQEEGEQGHVGSGHRAC